MKKLRRFRSPAIFGGVCAGLAYRLNIPLWCIRMLWAFSVLVYGFGLIPYLLLWIFVPGVDRTPQDYEDKTGEPDDFI